MFKKYILFILLALLGTNAYGQVAVIAHKKVPLTKIKKSQLLDFYVGDIRAWSNDEPVTVFDLNIKGTAKEDFYRYLGKSPSRMKSLWMKRMLSGEGDPPEALASEQKMLEKVANTPGAIGFVGLKIVSDKVKVLAIIGN